MKDFNDIDEKDIKPLICNEENVGESFSTTEEIYRYLLDEGYIIDKVGYMYKLMRGLLVQKYTMDLYATNAKDFRIPSEWRRYVEKND